MVEKDIVRDECYLRIEDFENKWTSLEKDIKTIESLQIEEQGKIHDLEKSVVEITALVKQSTENFDERLDDINTFLRDQMKFIRESNKENEERRDKEFERMVNNTKDTVDSFLANNKQTIDSTNQTVKAIQSQLSSKDVTDKESKRNLIIAIATAVSTATVALINILPALLK